MSTKCMNMKMNIPQEAEHSITICWRQKQHWPICRGLFFQRKQNQNWTNICIEIVSHNKCSVCKFYCRWLLCHQQSTNEGNVYIRNWEKRTWKRMESESVSEREAAFWSLKSMFFNQSHSLIYAIQYTFNSIFSHSLLHIIILIFSWPFEPSFMYEYSFE